MDREGEAGQAMVTNESWADVSVYGFWKWGTSAVFDMLIVYLQQTSANSLSMEEKEKKNKYLQTCLDLIRYFTPIVYSADGFPGMEDVAAHRRLSLLLRNKLKQ